MTNYHYTIGQLRTARKSTTLSDYSQIKLIDDLLAAHEELAENQRTMFKIAMEVLKLKAAVMELSA